MRTNTNFKKGSRVARSPYNLAMKSFLLGVIVLACTQTPLRAQDARYTKPSLWFGGAAAANFNFYQGTTQELNSDLTVPAAFHHGFGVGLYLAPLVEYHRPDSRWGIMLQTGFDGRNGKFNKVMTPCNCEADLSTNLHYLTVEPSLRFAPFRGNFYLFAGPRLAYNLSSSFTYKLKPNVAFPEQVASQDVKGDFSNMNKVLLSMQIGAGYDIPLSTPGKQTSVVLSPFVSFQPYLGQDPRSMETWTVTTLRAGAAIKFGWGDKIQESSKTPVGGGLLPTVNFSVISPENIPTTRRVREIFPLRNYVFFDVGSTVIPNRYVLLTKDQVKDFKEDQLEVFTPKALSGRATREMVVYYNILNILGDRMQKNPSSQVRLTGASLDGVDIGVQMAETVKGYLVSVFSINPSRIDTEGRLKPRLPSEQPGGTKELELLREGDNRVSIFSTSPALLMEFQSGPDAILKPVEFVAVQEAPIDSYVIFNVDTATKTLTSWTLDIKDNKGKVQHFGPYAENTVSIPGKSILGTRPEGDFKVTMVGHTYQDKTITREASVHMVLWTPSINEEGLRYSVIYEFNESKSILIYQDYLSNIVTPKIPKGATVIIHGHTDIIGDADYNQTLSLARANDVKTILESSLAKAGRTDVKFEVIGFGENQTDAPFENRFPEERFYNRTVIIDIIPAK